MEINHVFLGEVKTKNKKPVYESHNHTNAEREKQDSPDIILPNLRGKRLRQLYWKRKTRRGMILFPARHDRNTVLGLRLFLDIKTGYCEIYCLYQKGFKQMKEKGKRRLKMVCVSHKGFEQTEEKGRRLKKVPLCDFGRFLKLKTALSSVRIAQKNRVTKISYI
ncbi:hypothetical protein WA026_010606 [Henosepilachna vigintioctopunctata]|uniref:Uncharacterized protein n=1 Tax=Henosepilachna vigintioctopunctata TaxID=420089 RepID=A0AAW1V7A0_9CUCU